MNEQIFIGTTFALLCLVGMIRADWLLEHSKQGQRFVARWGPEIVLRYLQVILLGGVLLGILLATNVIRPVRWESSSAVQTLPE